MSDGTPRIEVLRNGDAEARARAEYLAAGGHPAHANGNGVGSALTGYDTILRHFRAHYQATFRRGDRLYSSALAREVTRSEACAAPGIALVAELANAADAPRATEGVIRAKLPHFFKTWAPSAWVDLLAGLPEEEAAEEVATSAAEQFGVRVAESLNTLVSLGYRHRNGDREETQRRTVLDWCQRFAKAGTWGDVRGHKVWAKLDESGGLCVALRVELFGQLRLSYFSGITQNKFGRLAEMYEVGSSGKAGRTRVVVLAPQFLAEYLSGRGAGIADSDGDGAAPRACATDTPKSPINGGNDDGTAG